MPSWQQMQNVHISAQLVERHQDILRSAGKKHLILQKSWLIWLTLQFRSSHFGHFLRLVIEKWAVSILRHLSRMMKGLVVVRNYPMGDNFRHLELEHQQQQHWYHVKDSFIENYLQQPTIYHYTKLRESTVSQTSLFGGSCHRRWFLLRSRGWFRVVKRCW